MNNILPAQQLNNIQNPSVAQVEQLIDNVRATLMNLNPNDLNYFVNQNILNQKIIQLEQLKNNLILTS